MALHPVCSIPQGYLYTMHMDEKVPACLTRKDTECVARELTRIYSSQDRSRITGCTMACVRHSFK